MKDHAPLDWHNASDHQTLDGLLACPLHHREFLIGPAALLPATTVDSDPSPIEPIRPERGDA